MELNPFRKQEQKKKPRRDRAAAVIVDILLDVSLEQLPCSPSQLSQALTNIRSKMVEGVEEGKLCQTHWISEPFDLDPSTYMSYKFSTRLVTIPSENDKYYKHHIVAQRKTIDFRKGGIDIFNCFAYHWQEDPSDTPIVTVLEDQGLSKQVEFELSPTTERYSEAVGIIVVTHEKLIGTDPRLLVDFE